MKKLIILLAFISTVSLAQKEAIEIVNGPIITFEELNHSFGDILQGDKVEHIFNFKNTGNEPLIITDIQTTCGCTATNWEREPILPNKKSSLKVTFNSAGKIGKQNKVATIISNSVGAINQVKIMTNVLPKEKKEQ